ncbi:nucleotidyltransferase domain-containing protein [Candidatus Woesearchaeota archaeon]|nr:nucleotidyltransferase domain-containing protein [Candidatus Woesearchaeota archaeon]
MKTQTLNAISYSFDMLAFVFQKKEINDKVRSIYLFGSSVRGELSKGSDIDLFFDIDEKQEDVIKRIVDSGIINFEASKDYEKWKLLNFTHPFSIQAGNLGSWELKSSIASEGILLYANNLAVSAGERNVLFVIKYPKSKKKYIKTRRLLFGRDEKFYKGTGRVQQVNGRRLSHNVFIIPKTAQKEMMDVLSKEKIDFSMTEIMCMQA